MRLMRTALRGTAKVSAMAAMTAPRAAEAGPNRDNGSCDSTSCSTTSLQPSHDEACGAAGLVGLVTTDDVGTTTPVFPA